MTNDLTEMARLFKYINKGKKTFNKMYTVKGIEVEKNEDYDLTTEEIMAVEECKTENFIPWMSKMVLKRVNKYALRRIKNNQTISQSLIAKHYRNNMKAAVWEAQKCIGEFLIEMKKSGVFD